MLADASSIPATSAVTVGLGLGAAAAALGWPVVRSVALSATYPGGRVRLLGQASPAPGGVWEAVVGLERGCAMVRVVMSS